jgi:DNA-binding response OmpR family regulator
MQRTPVWLARVARSRRRAQGWIRLSLTSDTCAEPELADLMTRTGRAAQFRLSSGEEDGGDEDPIRAEAKWSRDVRLLIVEDEQGLAESMRRGLVGEGFVVEVVHDGDSGLWAATESTFDVIVLDIMLPGLNGYKVLERLRERKIWTPVLMLTAKDGEYDQTDAFDLGADDYLTKPFSFIVLVAHLRALIRRGAPERPNKITVGTLVLDPVRRSVTRRGEVIKLTAREFGMLVYLMRNSGAVVGKFDILENVWDSAYEGSENIVEVYIGYLRKKIDRPFGVQTLTTVRGMGYRLDADASASAEAIST